MDKIIIKLSNGEKIEATVSNNEDIDKILNEKGYTRDNIQGISVVGG